MALEDTNTRIRATEDRIRATEDRLRDTLRTGSEP